MKAIGKVVEIKDNYALVTSQRQSACASCHNCEAKNMCHAELIFGEQKQDVNVLALNNVGADVGDTVELESSTGRTLSIAMLVFLLPFILTAFVYYLIRNLAAISGVLPLILICAFIFSFLIITKLVNMFIQNKNTIVIVAILEENQSLEAE